MYVYFNILHISMSYDDIGLAYTVAQCSLAIVKFLVSNVNSATMMNFSANCCLWTRLERAARRGHTEMTFFLLQTDADINAIGDRSDASNGVTG